MPIPPPPPGYNLNPTGDSSGQIPPPPTGFVLNNSQPTQPQATPQQTTGQQLKQAGILGDAGVGIFDSLTHGLQMVGQDIGQGIMGKTNQQTIQSYATNAATLTDLAAKQTDPTLKQKYTDMATSMLKDGQQAGLDLKGRTPEQIIGDVLEAGVETGTAITGGLGVADLLGAGGEAVAEQGVGKASQSLGQKIIKGGLTGAKYGGAIGAGQGTAQGLQSQGNTSQVVGSGITGGLIGAGTGAVLGAGIPAVAGGVGKIGEMATSHPLTPNVSSEDLISKITGATTPEEKTADLATAKALGEDLTKSGNSQDLVDKVQAKATANTKQVNNLFENDPLADRVYSGKDLTLIDNISKGDVKNVNNAFDDLKSVYKNTRNAEGDLKNIKDLETKWKSGKFVAKDFNDLAKEYGREFSQDSFTKLGTPKTSISAEAAENTRTSLKNIARELMPGGNGGEAARLDQETSNLLDTKNRLAKQAKAVENIKSNTKVTTPAKQMIGKAAKAISQLKPSNIAKFGGEGTSNALEMEGQLPKNLALLKKLLTK